MGPSSGRERWASYQTCPSQRWQPAPPRGLKINTDASVRPGAGFYTTGVVIRDKCGFLVAMQELKVIGQLSAEDAEAMAVLDGLILARDRGYQIAVTECDPLRVDVGFLFSWGRTLI
ncbi:Ribonuclease H-like domain containing protein [Abeliophyllum distichum]|uniref:Ribonuclease H-like domain containing protein n=1 Tax=Abeliophyllum distichum TaxID=126358 RepID=A0ABD1PEM5_9LAMI